MADINLLQKDDLKSSDFTNDNSNNKEGIGIRVSPDKGNLLQQRTNGLYYGIEAPPNLANLYVDAINGVDQHPEEVEGAGTRAKPLKTFAYANSVALEGTTRTIHLMADQDHVVPTTNQASIKPGTLNVRMYGPVYDAYRLVHTANEDTSTAMRNDNKLPRLVLTGCNTYKWYGSDIIDVVGLTTIYNKANTLFDSIHIVLDNNVTIEPTAPERNTLHAYNLARILNENALTLYLCKVTSSGTTVTSPQFVHGIVSLYDKATGIITRFNKNFIGLVASELRLEAITSLNNIVYESKNMFTSERAWGVDYLGSINLSMSGLQDNHAITDYVFAKTFDELPGGGRVIINPTTDVPSNHWY